ncbi:MAG: hypothetical protein AAF725_26370, partial [Acidobacteriota bacterium]
VALFAILSLAQSTGFFAVRYYVPLWPLWIVLSGVGVLLLAEALHRRAGGVRRPWLLAALAALPLLSAVTPVRALLALRGNPVELSRLAARLDAEFPAQTPCLVNGMNVVAFEMRPHPPSRVVTTFTVPDIGLAEWRKRDWRSSAETFLRRFPLAPLVQQGRNFYEHPEVGPWDFPESYFARSFELRNEPAIELRRLLLGGSLDFYSSAIENSRAVVRVSYNRPDDLLARAREEGREALVFFGDDWGYFKTPDFADWRVLEESSSLIVHNLTETPTRIEVVVHAQAATGAKEIRLRVQGQDATDEPFLFPAESGFEWRFQVKAKPGATTLELRDELYAVGRAPLLVSHLEAAVRASDP